MCISVFVWQAHPVYPLILLFNRDEFHDRPTKALSWWEWEEGEILGGRDEVGGGTWLGCTRNGRLAFLTNVREPLPLPSANTRGFLPLLFLKSSKSPMDFAEEVLKEADQYNGYNLILSDLCSNTMVYVSNRPKGEPSVREVSPGIHVLSNAQLDTPWQKAQRLGRSFEELLLKHGNGEVPVEVMAEELMNDTTKSDENSPPGIECVKLEYNKSSIFVTGFDTPMGCYGTRSTSALSVTASGEMSFYEKCLVHDEWKECCVNFQILG